MAPRTLTLHAGITVQLPGDEFAAADLLVKIRPLWEAMTAGLKEANVKYDQELKTSLTKPAPAAGNGARRGRKPRTDPIAPAAAPLEEREGA